MVEGFRWILPGQLAGSGRPGLFESLDVDLDYLCSAGIQVVISLTQEPLLVPEGYALSVHHFPIPDMGISTPRKTKKLCDFILDAIDRKQPVLVHCKAGLGRTGTILACYLVSRGAKPKQTIEKLRRICPHYIQNKSQEMFIEHYASFLLQTKPIEGHTPLLGLGMVNSGGGDMGVLFADHQGKIAYANRSAGNLLGVWPGALMSTNVFDHFDTDWLGAALSSEAPSEHERLPARLCGESARRERVQLSTYRVKLEASPPWDFIILLWPTAREDTRAS